MRQIVRPKSRGSNCPDVGETRVYSIREERYKSESETAITDCLLLRSFSCREGDDYVFVHSL